MRNAFQFLIQQLVLATVFYVILVSSARVDFGGKKDVDITIVQGDIGSGKLTLNPGDSVLAYSGKKVTWLIDPSTSNVDSFWIEKKDRSTQIFYFFDHPPSRNIKRGSGRVDIFRSNAEYIYSIHWKDKQGAEHMYDPKIAIKPSRPLIEWLIIGAYGVLALISLLRFFSINNKK